MTNEPVFVDHTGRRRRLLVAVGAAGTFVLLLSLVALVAGLTGVGPTAVPGWPGAAAAKRTSTPTARPTGSRPAATTTVRPAAVRPAAVRPTATRSVTPTSRPVATPSPSPSSAATAAPTATAVPGAAKTNKGRGPSTRPSKKNN